MYVLSPRLFDILVRSTYVRLRRILRLSTGLEPGGGGNRPSILESKGG